MSNPEFDIFEQTPEVRELVEMWFELRSLLEGPVNSEQAREITERIRLIDERVTEIGLESGEDPQNLKARSLMLANLGHHTAVTLTPEELTDE
jgi:hypothetical protein